MGSILVPALHEIEAARQVFCESQAVDPKMPDNPQQIIIRAFDQLQQKMLDFDFIMGARKTQAGGGAGYQLCDFSERGKMPMRKRTSAGTP